MCIAKYFGIGARALLLAAFASVAAASTCKVVTVYGAGATITEPFTGGCKDGLAEGVGQYTESTTYFRFQYKGELVKGLRNGQGSWYKIRPTSVIPDEIEEGEWKNGRLWTGVRFDARDAVEYLDGRVIGSCLAPELDSARCTGNQRSKLAAFTKTYEKEIAAERASKEAAEQASRAATAAVVAKREREIAAQNDALVREKQTSIAKELVGKIYWYVPNTRATRRLAFFQRPPLRRTSGGGDLGLQNPVSFDVTSVEAVQPNANNPSMNAYYLRIKFSDGKHGYVDHLDFGRHVFNGTQLEQEEYLFSSAQKLAIDERTAAARKQEAELAERERTEQARKKKQEVQSKLKSL